MSNGELHMCLISGMELRVSLTHHRSSSPRFASDCADSRLPNQYVSPKMTAPEPRDLAVEGRMPSLPGTPIAPVPSRFLSWTAVTQNAYIINHTPCVRYSIEIPLPLKGESSDRQTDRRVHFYPFGCGSGRRSGELDYTLSVLIADR